MDEPSATRVGSTIRDRELGTLIMSELWWRDHYNDIKARGYSLRPRYHPRWVPSWRDSGKHFYMMEDGQATILRAVMDATRLSDGKRVMLKRFVPEEGPHEVSIIRYFSSAELRDDSRNHCVPLLDLIDIADDKLVVMPLLRPFDNPRFQTFGEFVAFFPQICEGLQFMHQKNVAYRDCTANNIMFDPSGMYPNGYHPVNISRSGDFKGRAKRYARTDRPPRYYLIDFGLSRRYSSRNVVDELLFSGDRTVPELLRGGRCNPFLTDIYCLGNLVRKNFLMRCNGFEFMQELVDEMTDENSKMRPTIDEVIERFGHIRDSLSSSKLRSIISLKKDPSLFTALRQVREIGRIAGSTWSGVLQQPTKQIISPVNIEVPTSLTETVTSTSVYSSPGRAVETAEIHERSDEWGMDDPEDWVDIPTEIRNNVLAGSSIYNLSSASSKTSVASYKTEKTINSRKSRYNALPRRKYAGFEHPQGLMSFDVDVPKTVSEQRPIGLAPRLDAVLLQLTMQNPVLIDSEANLEVTSIRERLGAEIKPRFATLVENMYDFKTSQAHASISYNARRAQVLLKDLNFIYPHEEPRTVCDPYRHPIIQQAIDTTWFRNKDDIGVVDHEHFSPMPVSIIAITLTVIECCIDEWSDGMQRDSSWDDAKFQTVYDSHVSSLFYFQAHSSTNNRDVLNQLQCDLLRNARKHAEVPPYPVTGSSRFPPGAFDDVPREEDDPPDPTTPPNYDHHDTIPRITIDHV